MVAWGKNTPLPPGYYYPTLRTVTDLIFINFVPTGDIFFTADLADMVRTYKRK
jgi:hypothetical protein